MREAATLILGAAWLAMPEALRDLESGSLVRLPAADLAIVPKLGATMARL
ncbi:hypothetical protein RGQ15_20345 [Paracoccus sp. MBLB3053]|uniref:Uncharacterized protein n=1 Tax=Paracoccus aurantius TaxID=3073814 RepID=A0ABU2I043_9RHOB|nr:hypothetical protein [Paracoccus sp. MBLB3053]MDS9469909.1 hypothetical protein [Paracoccus sp. MBLB3053]